MTLRNVLGSTIFAATLGALVPSAEAVTFKFSDPGATTPTGGTPCFGGEICGDTLTWEDPAVNVTASAFGLANAVIQDLDPDYGGLGAVFHVSHFYLDAYFDPLGDEVNWKQGLKLEFSLPVFLGHVRFNDEDHGPFDDCATFLFSTDGTNYDSMHLSSVVDFDGLEGQTFYFKYGGEKPEDFYIAKMSVEPVPEPGTMLLLGSGLVGLAARARSRKNGEKS